MSDDRPTLPWTKEQVAGLNEFQQSRRGHPFTCPNRGDGKHRTTSDLGVLVATEQGWVCPDCDYTQNWAHGFMFKGAPPKMPWELP